MTRQPGEENLSDLEVQILDLTDEWHSAEPNDEAYGTELVEFIAAKLGLSFNDAGYAIYGPHWKDGAIL
jgi:hypothetical protein